MKQIVMKDLCVPAVIQTLSAALQNLPEVSQHRVTFTDSVYNSAVNYGAVRKNRNHPHCKASHLHQDIQTGRALILKLKLFHLTLTTCSVTQTFIYGLFYWYLNISLHLCSLQRFIKSCNVPIRVHVSTSWSDRECFVRFQQTIVFVLVFVKDILLPECEEYVIMTRRERYLNLNEL